MKATPQISSCLTRDVRLSGRTHTAFTLVELIVVITILAILGTIGFVSFSGYTGSARDSTRSEDMSNIAKSLSVYMATNGKYPAPETAVNITSNAGTVALGTQGVAGKTTLSTIKFNGAGLDPIDNAYYTYTTDVAYSKFAILGYFEGQSNITALNNAVSSAYADAGVFTNRFVSVSGDPIGVIVNGGTMAPIQNGLVAFDVTTGLTGSGAIAYLRSKSSIAGTASSLQAVQFIRKPSTVLSTAQQNAFTDIATTVGTNQAVIRNGATVGTGTVNITGTVYTNTGSACGVVAPNGNIYFIPGTVATTTASNYVVSYTPAGTTTGAINISTAPGASTTLASCVLGQNGKIYGIPTNLSLANVSNLLEVDPVAGTATLTSLGANAGADTAIAGATLGANGKIYVVPATATKPVYMIDPVAKTVTSLGTTSAVAYGSPTLALDGNIYAAGNGKVLVINAAAGTISEVANATVGAVAYRSVLAANGTIVGIPATAIAPIVITPTTLAAAAGVQAFSNALVAGANGGVLAPNGKIYTTPNLATIGSQELDPVALTVNGVPTSLGLATTGGAVLAPNGLIYAAQSASPGRIITITPAYNGSTFSTATVTSEFSNRF